MRSARRPRWRTVLWGLGLVAGTSFSAPPADAPTGAPAQCPAEAQPGWVTASALDKRERLRRCAAAPASLAPVVAGLTQPAGALEERPEPEPEGDGRGATGMPAGEARARRTDARLHAALGGAVSLGTATSALAVGAGLSADLGVVVKDRSSFFFHGDLTTVGLMLVGALGAMAEHHFSDRLSAGVGLTWGGWFVTYPLGNGVWSGVAFPLRVTVNLVPRKATEVARAGAFLALAVAPGLSTQPTYFSHLGRSLGPEFGIAFTLSAGFGSR